MYGGLIDKKFKVEKGGTIRWDGDPMNAVLDLVATYKTTANPAVLLESASFNKKVDTNVSILLNGNLSNPEPDFNIDFPNVSSVLKSEIDYKLQDKDALFLENALNKLGLSVRAYHRILKVSRTIADLSGEKEIQQSHLAEALGYRAMDRLLQKLSIT